MNVTQALVVINIETLQKDRQCDIPTISTTATKTKNKSKESSFLSFFSTDIFIPGKFNSKSMDCLMSLTHF